MQRKFQPLIEHINEGVVEFNLLLADHCKIKMISTSDAHMFRETVPGKWGGDVWPSSDYGGVYFLLASHISSDSLGLYIGKATMHTIGGRLAAHTKKYRNSAAFIRPSPDGDYKIEAIAAIAITEPSQVCIASSLEEFLLSRGVGRLGRLLNYVGVRPRK